MDLLATLSRHLIAPAWAAWERSPYLQHYRRLRKSQFDPPEQIRLRQIEALRAVAGWAAKMPFWRARFAAAGVHSEGITGLDDLQRLPLLTKADLRSRVDELVSQEYLRGSLHRHATSGSTGVSVVTFHDEASVQFKRACTLRSDEWSGWRLGERVAAIWGNPQVRTDLCGRIRRALLERYYVYLDTLNMDDASMGRFADTLLEVPPSMLFGHAHSLYLFAGFLQSCRADAVIRPKAILSTCMVLHDFERALIEEVFGCRVTNRYGCEEVSLIACECEQHSGLHINAEGILVEVLRGDCTPCEPGEPGRIVVTDLVNRGMPLLRYEVGDMGVLSDRRCPCGRGLPMLERVEGRVADYVVTPRGKLISGISLTENFAVMVPGIAQLQIVQKEIDRVVFRIVKGPDFNLDSMATIGRLVQERFGDDMHYLCEYVDRIPQEPSGKYRFCISHVEKRFAVQERG